MVNTTVYRFSCFEPPTTYGPVIDVIAEQITAVKSRWDSHANVERAEIHLVGGETILVCETVEQVWSALRDQILRMMF